MPGKKRKKKKADVLLSKGKKDTGNILVNIIPTLENVAEQILKAISKHNKDKKVIRGSQHRFV